MSLFAKIFSPRVKTLSELSAQELRKEEILLTRQRDRLFKKIQDLATQKQSIFQQGSSQKSPELRKALAMDFELKTAEQVMSARELNLRSKELLTVSRLRMIQQTRQKGSALGRLKLTDKDVGRISSWIEDDAVGQEMYTERLDELLNLGAQSDADALAAAGLSESGKELMHLWDQLDRGAIKEPDAFTQADRAARRRAGELGD